MIPVNNNNFIRWYTPSGQTLPLSNPLPYPGTRSDYVRTHGDRQCKIYRPVVAPGEEFSFFMNTAEPVDHNTADLRLAVVRGTTTLQTFPNVSYYSDPTVGSTKEWLYRYVTLNAMSSGIIQLVIYRNSDSVILYFSNPLQVLQQSEAEAQTTKVEFSNSRNIYFFEYVNISFSHKIRLHLFLNGFEPEGNTENYRSVNTGRLRNLKSEPDMAYSYRTGAFDIEAHRAMSLMTYHDDIKLNGRNYIRKEDYVTNWNLNSVLSSGTLSLYEQEFSQINRHNNTPASTDFDIRRVGNDEDVRVVKKSDTTAAKTGSSEGGVGTSSIGETFTIS